MNGMGGRPTIFFDCEKVHAMTDLRAFKSYIVRVEAGGPPHQALRREFNTRLRAYRKAYRLKGGGGTECDDAFADAPQKQCIQALRNKQHNLECRIQHLEAAAASAGAGAGADMDGEGFDWSSVQLACRTGQYDEFQRQREEELAKKQAAREAAARRKREMKKS